MRTLQKLCAVWDFIVLDRTPQDFSGLPMRKWSLLHNNCAPISKVKKFRDLHNKSIDFVFWGDLCLCTIICFISEEISCGKRFWKELSKTILDSKEFSYTFDDFTVLLMLFRTLYTWIFYAFWEFIVLDRTLRDFWRLLMRKWSMLHNNCAPKTYKLRLVACFLNI